MHAAVFLTTIGATFFSCSGRSPGPLPAACTVTMLNALLSTGAKMPGVSALAATWIVAAFGNVTVGAGMPE